MTAAAGHGAQEPQPHGCAAQLAALRREGAHGFEPVRFFYLELLERRAQEQPERVRLILQERLARELAQWQQRRAQAAQAAKPALPEEAATLTPNAQATQAPSTGQAGSLTELTHYLGQQSGAPLEGVTSQDLHERSVARLELKSVRHFRNTWSKLSVDRQLAQALNQAPKNAGPINSHMLVLRSLALMRDIAPDYLNRFTSYVDTLLSLEQSERAHQAAVRAEAESSAGKKTKPRSRRRGA